MDQYDFVAVFLGVIFTLQKLDAQSRDAAQQPNVAPEDFARWQRQAVAAWTPGSYASFFRVIFHYGFIRYVTHHPLSLQAYSRIPLVLDVIWFACVVTTLVRANAARQLRGQLGITLEKAAPTR